MEATDARTAGALSLRPDPTAARLTERVIAVGRALLSVAAVLVIRLDPPEPSRYLQLTSTLLVGYVAFAAITLAVLLRATSIPRRLPIVLQGIDVAFGMALTLSSSGPDSPLFTFLLYPLLAAAYRWGFFEVMVTAGVVDVLLGVEALLVNSAIVSTPSERNQFVLGLFLMRAIYVGATGATVGYLAETEKRRRIEAREISLVLMQARLSGKVTETVNLVLSSVRRVFRAREVLLVMQEQESGRVWIWKNPSARPDGADDAGARPEVLPMGQRDDYLFDLSGTAWHAVRRPWAPRGPFSLVAVNEFGQRVDAAPATLPSGFLAAHPCQRLIGVSVQVSDEWSGRLFVIAPGVGIHREESARFALDMTRQVAPTVHGHYLVRRLRRRAEALERGRIARELHDGVTQSLLGLEMELVVLHRRASVQAPQLTEDLARVHQIVRKEVITVRELMEGIRVGDVESGDLLQHLSEIVDRFGRYTGIAARFLSDGQSVTLTPHVRRQVARIVHEALVNVRRHADADRVVVRADVDGTCWKLSIEDDGRGFPFAGRLSQGELDKFRQGPRTIGERLRLIGGVMAVESKPGFGAKVEIGIPLRSN